MSDTENEILRKHLAKQDKDARQEAVRRAIFGPIPKPDNPDDTRPPEAA